MRDSDFARRLIQLAVIVICSLLIPLIAGAFLDGYFDSKRWLVLAGVIVGSLVATIGVVRTIRAAYQGVTKKHTLSRRTQSSAKYSVRP